ncbi:MAG: damage-control phosphatase ARMT1 family protein [bacterium]
MTRLDCIPCLLAHALKTIRKSGVGEDLERELFAGAVEESRILLEGAPAPVAARAIYRSISARTGIADPFRDFKVQSTKMALRILPRLQEIVANSQNPFVKAVEFAIAGNAIDLVQMEEENLNSIIGLLESHSAELSGENDVEKLQDEIRAAKTVLIIGDNAGEAVFDTLLLEQMHGKKHYYSVRGGPALNDVVEIDAIESGIGDFAEIISSESNVPGTLLEEVGEKFREVFDHADVVIAKGQGNLETLDDAPRPIYHLFKAKCEPIARLTGRKVGDFVVWRNSPKTAP